MHQLMHLRVAQSPPGAREAAVSQVFPPMAEKHHPQARGKQQLALMVREAQKSVSDWASEAKAIAKNGEIGNGRTTDRPSHRRSIRYGDNAGYLTARIARDRPDILERMKAGEFSSVRRAQALY